MSVAMQSACNALVNLADRLKVACIPQGQMHKNNLGRRTCVPAAPALQLWCMEMGSLFSVAFIQ